MIQLDLQLKTKTFKLQIIFSKYVLVNFNSTQKHNTFLYGFFIGESITFREVKSKSVLDLLNYNKLQQVDSLVTMVTSPNRPFFKNFLLHPRQQQSFKNVIQTTAKDDLQYIYADTQIKRAFVNETATWAKAWACLY